MDQVKLKKLFTNFFESKGHLSLPSFSLVPNNDPSLLLINSGVAALKKYFLNSISPPAKRIVLNQNCVRTIDIDEIGTTPFHLTYFVMLGNFSFNDYFKKEAINYAWEFLTITLKNYIDQKKLLITAYKDDTETINYWLNEIKIPTERLILRQKKYNFWDLGVGPCGACTEIYYDLGKTFNHIDLDPNNLGTKLLKEDIKNNRYIEIWNIVFSEFNHLKDGTYKTLEYKNIDTGAGLERIYTILKKKSSVFETDVFFDIIETCDKLFNHKNKINFQNAFFKNNSKKYTQELCIIADHIRTSVFLIRDKVFPANKGKGFVLRRLLRKILDISLKYFDFENKPSFLGTFIDKLFEKYKFFDFELNQKKEIKKILITEEKIYLNISKNTKDILNSFLEKWKKTTIDNAIAEDIFKLFTTYGYSKQHIFETLEASLSKSSNQDRLKKIHKEINFLIEKHKLSSKKRIGFVNPMPINDLKNILSKYLPSSEKTNKIFNSLSINSNIILVLNNDKYLKLTNKIIENNNYLLIFKKTNFFPTGGGQIYDLGKIYKNNSLIAFVKNVFSIKDIIIHEVIAKKTISLISKNDVFNLRIDQRRRKSITNNHSATHLLHSLLKQINPMIRQAGSLVEEKYLRFDYYSQKINQEDIDNLETSANKIIKKNIPITEEYKKLTEIINDNKIEKNFLEKYSSKVRIISFNNISSELCGGLHVSNLNEIKNFLIFKNFSKSVDVQRIIIFTDLKYYHHAISEEFEQIYNSQISYILENINNLLKNTKFKEKINIYKNLEKNLKIFSKEENYSKINKIFSYKQLRSFLNEIHNNIKIAEKDIFAFKQFLLINQLNDEINLNKDKIQRNIVKTQNSWEVLIYPTEITDKIKIKNISNLIFQKMNVKIIFFLCLVKNKTLINVYFNKTIEFNKFKDWFNSLVFIFKNKMNNGVVEKIIYPRNDQNFSLLIIDDKISENKEKIIKDIVKSNG